MKPIHCLKTERAIVVPYLTRKQSAINNEIAGRSILVCSIKVTH